MTATKILRPHATTDVREILVSARRADRSAASSRRCASRRRSTARAGTPPAAGGRARSAAPRPCASPGCTASCVEHRLRDVLAGPCGSPRGSSTVVMPARWAARIFSLRPPIGSTRPRSVISPVIATFWRTGMRSSARRHRGRHRDARRRAVLRDRALGEVDVDVDLVLEVVRRGRTCRRASAGSSSPPARDSCMTSPSLPVSVSLPLPGTIVTSAVEQVAAERRDGEAVGEADLVFLLAARLAVLLRRRATSASFSAVTSNGCSVARPPASHSLRDLAAHASRSRARGYGRRLPSCSGG